jgi:hypothetical protein
MNEPDELRRESSARRCGPVEMRLPADPGLVSAIRLMASGIAAARKCTIAEIDDVKLAVSEVLLALIEHGSRDTLSLSMQIADATFAISASTDADTFDRTHPDLALCETVLAEVCAYHSIGFLGSELAIFAAVPLRQSDER